MDDIIEQLETALRATNEALYGSQAGNIKGYGLRLVLQQAQKNLEVALREAVYLRHKKEDDCEYSQSS